MGSKFYLLHYWKGNRIFLGKFLDLKSVARFLASKLITGKTWTSDEYKIDIFDLVWRIQLIIIQGYKFVLRVQGIFNLKCLVLLVKFWYQNWVRFIIVYQKSLKLTFKTVSKHKDTFWICVLVLWIHKSYFVVK